MLKAPPGKALSIIQRMDIAAELAPLKLDPTVATEVANLIAQARNDAGRRATELHAANVKIQAMALEIAHLRRMRFGTKSETLSPENRELFEETQASDLAALEARLAAQQAALDALAGTAPKPPRSRAGRQPLPDHLPRIEHRHEPASCACGQCGKPMVCIGEDISEQLDVEPAKFFVHRHIRPQYACRGCQSVTAAPIPPAVIDGGLAAVGLLSWVVIGKYLDHLPLYRIERIAAREGVTLSRSTLAEWVGRIGVALAPLADRLGEVLRQRRILHADETPVQQLDPGSGKTKRAYLWAYRSNALETGPPMVVFDYQTSRSGAHARAFLGAWSGELMVDDFGGYKALFAQGIVELGCWAHARRKFFELTVGQPHPIAQETLRRIGELYAIEAEGRDMAATERSILRAELAQPRLVALHEWLTTTRLSVADGGGTAKAIDYTLKRWPALARYADDGLRPIDNNPVENAIRPICLGKKNWLFTGSESAGQRAAAIQGLLATAALNGLDPAAWLRETLEKLPTCLNTQIDSLLPLRYAQ